MMANIIMIGWKHIGGRQWLSQVSLQKSIVSLQTPFLVPNAAMNKY